MSDTLWRGVKESQLDFVRRSLEERGQISVTEALYQMRFRDGAATSITRLAGRIFELRREGYVIGESHIGGAARYRLVYSPRLAVA